MAATKTTDSDSSIEQKSDFDQSVEDVMEELPERFQNYSHPHSDKNMILVPEHTKMHDGAFGSRLISGSVVSMMNENGFEFRFASRNTNGVGVKFWFIHNDE